ncbi:MAG: hypothetical protein II951_10900 [Bacteroidales bacterium]|nr:hypothetical protein [Bacteroidales bacterium]
MEKKTKKTLSLKTKANGTLRVREDNERVEGVELKGKQQHTNINYIAE